MERLVIWCVLFEVGRVKPYSGCRDNGESGENPEQSCCRINGVFPVASKPLSEAWEGLEKC